MKWKKMGWEKGLMVLLVVVALVGTLQACVEEPTPTQSPISPPPTPAAAKALPRIETDAVTGTTAVYWDYPLVAVRPVTVCAGVDSGGPGGYVVYYACQGPKETCAGYPVTRAVEADTPDEACAVKMVLVVDLEARQDGEVLAAMTKWTSLMGASAPGTGQYDGDIHLDWEPALPDDVSGTVKVWSRSRWADPTTTSLPDVVLPYYVVGDRLREPDARGFVQVGAFEVKRLHCCYFPVIGWSSGWPAQ